MARRKKAVSGGKTRYFPRFAANTALSEKMRP
jgi:hypothetical protein